MITQNVSLWERTMSAQSKCRPFVFPFGRKLWYWWAKTPWCVKPYVDIWRTILPWRSEWVVFVCMLFHSRISYSAACEVLCCRSPCTNKLVSSYPRLSCSLDNRGRKVSDNHIHAVVISGYLTIVLWFDRLLPHIKGNVGFVFTKEDLAEVRDLLLANKVTIKDSHVLLQTW